ncbi:MAG: acetate--CoA ligase [Micavibrio sp.]|nr:acetate--CoA ligase [Micavibrio sp.]
MKTYKPHQKIIENINVSEDQYEAMYKGSTEQPDVFWAVQSQRLDWFKNPTIIKNTFFGTKDDPNVSIKWFEDGILNASYNCIDRHLPEKENDTALIFEGDDPSDTYKVTYGELLKKVSKLANAMKSHGVEKGDRVTIYMPMVCEAVYAMLACARIGAIHSVVFGGFSPDALRGRIIDCKSKYIITADEGVRASKKIPLKANVDKAIDGLSPTEKEGIKALVLKRTGGDIDWVEGRDIWWHDAVEPMSDICEPAHMNAEDPLFILYTSGSTGKPKGVLHTTGGYLLYASLTHETVFDYHDGDIYWCTADVGWVTGHSYIVYGPLTNGAISLVFEGVPTYPDASRFWQVVQKHKVNLFYTAPTAIRSLLKEGDDNVKKYDLSSLRILGTVGEPINSEAWLWYYNVVGGGRCPIVDTWWQTETGGHMVTPLPCHTLKPGTAQKPFFGVQPALVDHDGALIEGEGEGNFVMLDSWPGQMRTLYGDHKRFVETYFSTFPGMYFTGDGAKRDADGDYRITGRVDDVINVSGHRMGTAELEEAINEHEAVSESAITGYPHDIKGQGIYSYITLREGVSPSDDIKNQINAHLREVIGPIAKLDVIQWAPALPKTRSGKIMRRILRKIAAGEYDSLGDVSTLADPSVVDKLVAEHKK